MNKTCAKCDKEKPEDQFRKRKQGKYEWYSATCLDCHNQKNRQYQSKRRQDSTEEVRTYHSTYIKQYRKDPKHKEDDNRRRQEWVKNNPEKVLFNSARYRAKQRGLEFTLKLEDIFIPKACPILGIPLIADNKRSAPSLDRIDNSKGYTKDNCRVISWKANTIKSDLSLSEVDTFCKNIINYLKPTQ